MLIFGIHGDGVILIRSFKSKKTQYDFGFKAGVMADE
jgi:hypothetical protein